MIKSPKINKRIKLAIVLISASVVCMVGPIPSRVVHLVPSFVKLNDKGQLAAIG